MTRHTRDEVAPHVLQLVQKRAPKSIHFRKLRGEPDVKRGVIYDAAARLLAPDAVFPRALRDRLKPRLFGNITVRNIDPLDVALCATSSPKSVSVDLFNH